MMVEVLFSGVASLKVAPSFFIIHLVPGAGFRPTFVAAPFLPTTFTSPFFYGIIELIAYLV
jgi:hypothetical protein